MKHRFFLLILQIEVIYLIFLRISPGFPVDFSSGSCSGAAIAAEISVDNVIIKKETVSSNSRDHEKSYTHSNDVGYFAHPCMQAE